MTLAPLSTVGITRYHRPADGFTIIRDSFLRNAQTSLRAFRVGAYVLSHAAGFIQTQKSIARACGLSVTTVRAALEDLERDRYVARRVVRDSLGRIAGTAYAVSDKPFTQEELAQLCPPCTESEYRESVRTESVPPKKTTPARETMNLKQTNPSGGSPPGSNATEEAPMNTDGALALFEVEEPERPEQARPPGAQDVVAAYVDSYRKHHSGGNPARSDIGRVARDAKRSLDTGQATTAELIAAAAAMGSGPYANLGTQLNMLRERGQRGEHYGRIGRVAPREVFEEGARAAHLKFIAEIKSDPEVAAWVAEDPRAVADLIAEDPSLEAVFAQVSAA